MKPRQDRPRIASRVSTVVGIGALVAVAMAARSQGGQQTTQPPAVTPAMAPAAADTTKQDRTQVTDTTAMSDSMAMSDSAMMMHTATAAPVAEATVWPVDPVTGQTIINGEPVVGRVFIMQKTDGTVKLGKWPDQYIGEPMSPETANAGTSHAVPAPEQTRRMRGIMIQSTLWELDDKRSATERRHYRSQTTGAALGQR